MTREKRAIQILEQRACCMECVVGNCTCAECDEAFAMAIKALEQEPRWIPVSERLPKESDGIVLITVSGEVKTGQYSEFNNTWYKGDMCGVGGDDPIAWMPLPKSYSEVEE